MIRETRTERAGDALPLNRIEALSDGMFAIIMTLLVIEIKPPEVHDAAQVAEALRHSLVALLPKIVAYAISFLTLAIFWVSHHQHFHALQHADRGVLWLNNLLLLFLAFVPFPTAVLGEYPTQPLAVAQKKVPVQRVERAGFFACVFAGARACFDFGFFAVQ